ncbi:MAG: P-II family nitrogen regulator [Candidatus Margulisiibacteriota bacterium]|nr:P-II family nitrogen regulator [Candidatus Margulisiibacteriota bacterium]
MKKVEAIVRPERLEELREALDSKGFSGMTITEVKGRGVQRGITLEWRVGDYRVEFMPKIKIEMVLNDTDVNEVVDIIQKTCATGNIGDGKIFVYPIEQVVKIRTKENGTKAI